MKKRFSTSWIASKQPRKQRKYIANAPKHLKYKFMSVHLSKELKNKYRRRNIEVRKDDVVKILRGKFKKKVGKIIDVNRKKLKVYIEGIQIKKKDGSKINVPLHPSNLMITELNLNDKKRLIEKKNSEKGENKKEIKNPEIKKEYKLKLEKENAS